MPNTVPVLIPPLDLDSTELRVGAWHCRDGRAVREGERLVEIIAGEVVVDLAAPADGILRKLAEEDEVVGADRILAEIRPATPE